MRIAMLIRDRLRFQTSSFKDLTTIAADRVVIGAREVTNHP